eukprot:scaffold134061_cov35-Tisochrysis_lutea.AAC.7
MQDGGPYRHSAHVGKDMRARAPTVCSRECCDATSPPIFLAHFTRRDRAQSAASSAYSMLCARCVVRAKSAMRRLCAARPSRPRS